MPPFFPKRPPFTILYAHEVQPHLVSHYPSTPITPSSFRTQLRWLRTHFEIIALSEAVERYENGDTLRGCLVLTFDDGFRSAYDCIAPILTDENLPAAFFINNQSLDNQDFMWRSALSILQNTVPHHVLNAALPLVFEEVFKPVFNKKNRFKPDFSLFSRAFFNKNFLLKKSNTWENAKRADNLNQLWQACQMPPREQLLDELKPYLSTAQILEMHRAGFGIGGHTATHPFCNLLNGKELAQEITQANAELAAHLQLPITHFAYPFGNRPAPFLEQKMLENTPLKTVLGISYKKHNFAPPHQWNRIKMETTLLKTLLGRGYSGRR